MLPVFKAENFTIIGTGLIFKKKKTILLELCFLNLPKTDLARTHFKDKLMYFFHHIPLALIISIVPL
jgi:hypothetical protein